MLDNILSKFAAPAVRGLLVLCLCAAGAVSWAHEFGAGDVRIEHPFAMPSTASSGAAYLKRLKNGGSQADRLLGATSPVAERVELQVWRADAGGTPQMQTVPEIVLPPGADLQMRPGQAAQLSLQGLKQPLAEGDTFPLTLRFERAGAVEVKVYVQQPR